MSDTRKPGLPEGVMLNIYPDSCGGNLKAAAALLSREELKETVSLLYLLPSLFRSDLDRGFSVISYDLDEKMASDADLEAIQAQGISLKLDFVLNHLSVNSPQFQDMLARGDDSDYAEMFIDWNRFWEGKGEQGPEGYIIPEEKYLSKLFMRKPEMPLLQLPFPDGSTRFYWNTFYQNISREGDTVSYLGQMDLNADSEKVWDFYEETFRKLSSYGARIVRLDAFAYLHKEAGFSNFFNEPGTWDHLERLKKMADRYGLVLLPEIHSKYEEHIHDRLAEKGYPIYDFFFPGLVIDAIESGKTERLLSWMKEVREKGFQTVNMLGCHDGIPVLDIKGFIDETSIEKMIGLIKSRGGRVKDLFGADGQKISYYQVNAAFYSALGESDKKLLLARAIQLFFPGTPQVWYLDLFAGTNDYMAADTIGHKDINRTNLSLPEIEERLKLPVVTEQLKLLRFRNTFPAFGFDAEMAVTGGEDGNFTIRWEKDGHTAELAADLQTLEYRISFSKAGGARENLT